jgi:hypothetical protein
MMDFGMDDETDGDEETGQSKDRGGLDFGQDAVEDFPDVNRNDPDAVSWAYSVLEGEGAKTLTAGEQAVFTLQVKTAPVIGRLVCEISSRIGQSVGEISSVIGRWVGDISCNWPVGR